MTEERGTGCGCASSRHAVRIEWVCFYDGWSRKNSVEYCVGAGFQEMSADV